MEGKRKLEINIQDHLYYEFNDEDVDRMGLKR